MPRTGKKAPPQAIRRCGLTFREDREEAIRACGHARALLESAGTEVFNLEQVLDGEPVDAVLSFGGDGTLLHTARLMAPRAIPVLGVNFGRVGYLCAVSEQQLAEAIDILLRGAYRLDQRAMLRGVVSNRREEVWQVDALNEILVGGSNRTLTLELTIDGEHLGTIIGDGVIVATRTGSTAYAMSAGGPATMLECTVIVPSNTINSCLMAPAVIPITSEVKIRNLTRVARPYAIADGQKDYQIEHGTEVQIVRSPLTVSFVDPGLVSPAAKLSKSFGERRA
ncbi:MAG: NAD(+)/NADH kinase [Armatimonadetes bacterium]|nr:NAD(+)/NADH kinase [Armatimonadota bacterium]